MISRRGLLTVPLLAGAENLVPVRFGAQPAALTPVCEKPAGPDGWREFNIQQLRHAPAVLD